MKKKTTSYGELIKNPKWIEKRNAILTRDKNTCQYCGCTNRYMQVHHKRYVQGKMPWEYDDKDLVTLCDQCHEYETQANKNTYIAYQSLRNAAKKSGVSMDLVDSAIALLADVLNDEYKGDFDESAKAAVNFLKEQLYGIQHFEDMVAFKKLGIDVRELVENTCPQFINNYDKA